MKKYICLTIIFLVLVVCGSILDSYFNTDHLCSTMFKTLVIFICSLIIYKRKINIIEGRLFTKYLLICLIPMIINFILMFGPIDKAISKWVFFATLFRTIATATWEELHFRVVGVDMLKNKDSNLTKEYAILLVFIFAFLHMVNIFLNPYQILVELFRIILSLATGSLFLSLYLKTNNIFVPIIAHFLLNYTTLFFNTFSTNPNSLGIIVYNIVYYIGLIIYFGIAIYIIKKNKLVE